MRGSKADPFVEIIALPVSKATRDRYYELSDKLKELRTRTDVKKPKKMTQLAREALIDMMDEIEKWLEIK